MVNKKKNNNTTKMLDQVRQQVAGTLYGTILATIIAAENCSSWLIALALAFFIVGHVHLPFASQFGNLYAIVVTFLIRPFVLSIVTLLVCLANLVVAVQFSKNTEKRLTQGEELINMLKNVGFKTPAGVRPGTEEKDEVLNND